MDRKMRELKDIYHFIFIKFLLPIRPSLNLWKKETLDFWRAQW